MQDPEGVEYLRDAATGLIGPFVVEYVAIDSLGATGSIERSIFLDTNCPGNEIRCDDGTCSSGLLPSFPYTQHDDEQFAFCSPVIHCKYVCFHLIEKAVFLALMFFPQFLLGY